MFIKSFIHFFTIAFPLVFGEVTSLMIAIDRLIFPLLMPPTNLANTNIPKFVEKAHKRYENAIPIKHNNIKGFRP